MEKSNTANEMFYQYALAALANNVNNLLKKSIEDSVMSEADTLAIALAALESNLVKVITAIISCSSNPTETKTVLLHKVFQSIEESIERRSILFPPTILH